MSEQSGCLPSCSESPSDSKGVYISVPSSDNFAEVVMSVASPLRSGRSGRERSVQDAQKQGPDLKERAPCPELKERVLCLNESLSECRASNRIQVAVASPQSRRWLCCVASVLLVFLAVRHVICARASERVSDAIIAATNNTLGVETTIGSVRLNVFGGASTFDDLVLSNPPGFEGDLLHLEKGSIDLSAISLLPRMSRVVHVSHFDLEGVNIGVQLRGLSCNIQALVEAAKAAAARAPPKKKIGWLSEKLFVIDKLTLSQFNVSIDSDLLGQSTLEIVDLVIHDIGKESIDGRAEAGVTLNHLAMLTVKVILDHIASNTGGSTTEILSGRMAFLGGAVGTVMQDAAQGLAATGENADAMDVQT